MMKKRVLLLLVVLFVIGCSSEEVKTKETISNFEECIRAGYSAMESHPMQCMDGSGNTFVEEIGDVSGEVNQVQVDGNGMLFKVRVPENTPEGDIVNLVFNVRNRDDSFETKEVEMEKIGDYTHTVMMQKDDLGLLDEFSYFEYIYNRNGWGDITTEYLPLEARDRDPGNPFEYRNAKRSVEYSDGVVHEDEVQRWRWFPDGEVKRTSSIEPKGEFVKRVNNMEFKSGQGIQDLYIPGMEKFYDSTAEHMVDYGYKWAVIYPPWQWISSDPPKVGNSLELGVREDPNYPDDEELKRHIKAFKSEGLKVSLEPQICCTSIETEGRSSSWWDEYISEVGRFLVHHAKMAEETDVDMMLFDTSGIEFGVGNDERVAEMLLAVKDEYSGDIMIPISPFLYETDAASGTIPSVVDVPWASDVDYILFNSEGELSSKENPTDEELKAGAGRTLDLVKEFYDEYGTPIIVKIAPFSIKQSWKGPSFYSNGKIPGESGAEDVWGVHEFSNHDQARVVNAYFEAVAERPWVVGMMHFGYWHWDMPNLPDWSVRGKEAEDVWKKWNDVVYG